MNLPTVFMFSGQGSQHYQMGIALYEAEPVFRRAMMRMDIAYADLTGHSLLEHLYGRQDASSPFEELALTHPAIVMVECALAEMLMSEGIVPTLSLGCSLGSFSAAAASGWVSSENALAMAIHQAKAVQAYCEAGTMIAILGSHIQHASKLASLGAIVAAENFDRHFIVSAHLHDLEKILAYLHANDLASQILPVQRAFHTPWLDPAKSHFVEHVAPSIPGKVLRELWCCASAGPVASMCPQYFWDVVQKPIRFAETIRKLELQGPWRYVDLGPSGTLATFLKYLLPATSRSCTVATLSRVGRDQQCLRDLRAACQAVLCAEN
ncbi:acyltransferase domain-containing protein [Lacisediminimonas sp.]|uniref:acyltransferase domain-containing protein n=1 Tax=Lacisediminimonas sp. TaxID=3060582 RepID=UPI00272120B7|nr:acyltransferase domain-containing protein [Lacisediminimonas sp.]MDO8299356.1 acyltransferase domain-containing protein [Lacisediminimonas sp.]